ncbi:acyl-CoA dehydrogenase family protein [Salinisphaera sp.]|uniref:acyl-CoA dehydrogenase family protein n=1 Tax=Salinisphaera sp. TaxID=1914330 RepID=UPI002D796F03|nr:acyl-CoA dehydrogenase family protein [Salinisphaera sp.]HET7312782.1 acyl-CoA dehydrogenase family protein [Salinisphaera sp.]
MKRSDCKTAPRLDRDALDNPCFLRRGMARFGANLPLRDPSDSDEMITLLRRLYAAGRHDLALGRLFEGHVDALQIIGRYGRPELAEAMTGLARHGATFGVWNAPWREYPLQREHGRLSGGKLFASGAGVISHALVTLDAGDAGDADQSQLLLLDLAATPPAIDRDWWQVVGMQASETHRVRWHDQPLQQAHTIGAPGDYQRLPWFATGALRFVAVQAGGIAAIFDQVREHLQRTKRDGDPHQRERLARLYGLAQSAAAVCRDTGARQFEAGIDRRVAEVAHARGAVAEFAEQAIALAQHSVGLAGLFKRHPLSRVLTDLTVYLRQPGPDAQRMCVADAITSGELRPGL